MHHMMCGILPGGQIPHRSIFQDLDYQTQGGWGILPIFYTFLDWIVEILIFFLWQWTTELATCLLKIHSGRICIFPWSTLQIHYPAFEKVFWAKLLLRRVQIFPWMHFTLTTEEYCPIIKTIQFYFSFQSINVRCTVHKDTLYWIPAKLV